MALTENRHASEFIVSEAHGEFSRETIVLISGQNLKAGAVIAKVLFSGTAVATADTANTGNGTMGAVTVSSGAKPGIYRLAITTLAANAGTFLVTDPAGRPIGTGTVGVAFSKAGIAFTLADGATDHAIGDVWYILVIPTAVTGMKWTAVVAPGTVKDGSDIAAGILRDATNATSADVTCTAFVRSVEVNAGEIDYNTLSATNILAVNAQLASVGIVVRPGV